MKTFENLAIIIPTLGERMTWLEASVVSASKCGDAYIILVTAKDISLKTSILEHIDKIIFQESKGLASAINYAIDLLPTQIKFFTMLCDDDQLVATNLKHSYDYIETHEEVVAVYGACEYVNLYGNKIGINKSGSWASSLLKFGPNFIPAPGALIRLESVRYMGGINEQYKLAFDLDLFIRLKQVGKLAHIPALVSKYRWHSEAFSVKSRNRLNQECKQIRLVHLPKSVRAISFFWEIPNKLFSLIVWYWLNWKIS